jgi:aminoglycoside 2''-phosphotransferase
MVANDSTGNRGLLRDHGVRLCDGDLVLRPLTEQDWPTLLRWNNDSEVLYFTDSDEVVSRSMEEVQDIWRWVAQQAYCFMMELDGQPIGECWLQEMNIDRLIEMYQGQDCRRIDLCIGEKEFWNRGIGTRTIRLLTEFGFQKEGADAIFGLVGGHNPRSKGAFEKVGYRLLQVVPEPEGVKAKISWDLIMTREEL